MLLVWRTSVFPTGVLGTQECRGIHESLGAPHLTFSGLAKRFSHVFSRYPVTAVVFLDSGATGFVTTDSSAPVSTMKSMFWSPSFKVTMGSRGPDISAPAALFNFQVSKPHHCGRFLCLPCLRRSFFQRPKAPHRAHWCGCNGAQGFCWDRLKGCPVPGAEEVSQSSS